MDAARAAARAADLWKVYGSGEARVIALRGVNVEWERGGQVYIGDARVTASVTPT